MLKTQEIPRPVRRGYEILKNRADIQIKDSLTAVDTDEGTMYRFVYTESVGTPNPENVPGCISLRVDIPGTFPYDPPKVYSVSKEVQGFPHQDAETGKVCLFDESRAPLDESRLLTYVGWTKQWLQDAAQGKLLQTGDPYEIPDFSRRCLRKRIDGFPVVHTMETTESWPCWEDKVGQQGTVSFKTLNLFKGIVPVLFRNADRAVVAEFQLPEAVIDPRGMQIVGAWAVLHTLCYERHRPPQTYGELETVCKGSNVDLDTLLRTAWKASKANAAPCVILFGYAIPKQVGGPPARIHWQPLFFDGIRRQFNNHKQRKCKRIRAEGLFNRSAHDGEFAEKKPLLWGRTVNLSKSALYGRGALPNTVSAMKIAVCGCGALGCLVAEVLAREGVAKLRLFDHETFEIGNQCRHTLSGQDVGEFKAKALANRLQGCNPLSDIRGYAVRLPISPVSIAHDKSSAEELFSSDIILDCGMSEGAFQWLSREAKTRGIRMAAMFFNSHAQMLTFCASGKRISSYKVLCRLTRDIRAGKATFGYEEYSPQLTDADKVLPEIGCWHATFPALMNHILMLVSAGVEVAVSHFSDPFTDEGRSVIVRRYSHDPGAVKTLTEVVWDKRH